MVKFDEIPHQKRGESVFFDAENLDAWASRRIMALRQRSLKEEHTASTRQDSKILADDIVLPSLLRPEWIDLDFRAKTRRSVISDMVALAERTECLYDPTDLLRQITEREAVSSTALPGGIALLHPHHQDPYLISDPFMVIARAQRPVFFGAEDDTATDIFCLICCGEHLRHLHVLARLCMMIRETDLLERIRSAEDEQTVCEAFTACETLVLKSLR